MHVLYGIPNCDKVRAARKWLESKNIEFRFENIRENPISNSKWRNWIIFFGVEKIVNRRSTTWKQLPEHSKQNLTPSSVVKLLSENPTLMKRPLLTNNETALLLGFSELQYSEIFNR